MVNLDFLKKNKQPIANMALFMCLLLSLCGVVNMCNRMVGIPDDNPVEELVEDMIEGYWNLPSDSIDLTPDDTPEEEKQAIMRYLLRKYSDMEVVQHN